MPTQGPLSPDSNPLFSNPSNIPKDYWEVLKKDIYNLSFLGFPTEVRKIERIIKISNFPFRLSFQIYLIILKYLAIKDEGSILLTDKWVLAKELKGGIHFFDRSHPLRVKEIFEFYKNIEEIKKASSKFKGAYVSLGDFAYDFFVFPEIKVRYIFYEGDDEFLPNVTVNFQKGLEDYFNLDVIWAIVNVITNCLIEKK